MDVRVGFIVAIMLVGNWVCDARFFVSRDLSGVENTAENADVCALCEEYTTLAVDYLSQNKTQAQVKKVLHNYCHQMHGLKEKCLTLVDHYASLFFSEVSSVKPEEFCKSFGFCRKARMSSFPGKQNKCDLCHRTVDEVLDKLKDPDTKLEIIELLLKACNAVENYKKKCKSMVFEFGPVILTDAEKLIEQADICTTFHACSQLKLNTEEAFEGKIEMVTSS